MLSNMMAMLQPGADISRYARYIYDRQRYSSMHIVRNIMDKYKLAFGDAILVDFEPLLWYLFNIRQKTEVLGCMERLANFEFVGAKLRPVNTSYNPNVVSSPLMVTMRTPAFFGI